MNLLQLMWIFTSANKKCKINFEYTLSQTLLTQPFLRMSPFIYFDRLSLSDNNSVHIHGYDSQKYPVFSNNSLLADNSSLLLKSYICSLSVTSLM